MARRIDFGAGLAGVHVARPEPGAHRPHRARHSRRRTTAYADDNRARFAQTGVLGAEFRLEPRLRQDVAAGARHRRSQGPLPDRRDRGRPADLATTPSASAPPARTAIQINTGKGCHLDAHMVGHALDTLDARDKSACCSSRMSAISSARRRSISARRTRSCVLSITEGEDKPLEISGHVRRRRPDAAEQVRPAAASRFRRRRLHRPCACGSIRDLQTLIVSAQTGEGLPAFYAWIEGRARAGARARPKPRKAG